MPKIVLTERKLQGCFQAFTSTKITRNQKKMKYEKMSAKLQTDAHGLAFWSCI